MAQESRLTVVIDSQQAQRDAEALNNTLKKMAGIGEDATHSTDNLSIKIKAVNGETQKLTPSLNTATKAIENQNKELKKQEEQLGKNSDGLMTMAKYIGSFIALDRAIAAADGYTQMAARIRNATQSTEEYNLVQDRLLVTANTTFRALSEAQEVYLSLAGGMKSLGYATKDTLDLSDSLSFAFTANATRADQAQSAMDALSKAMAKGKIDADAWISIVTGADNVIADMAKTTGRTEAQIRKLGAEGKASLGELITTLIATREANEQLANNMENSFSDGLTKLTNEITVFLGKLNDTTKATGTMAAGLGYLGENIETLATIGGVALSIYGGRLAAAFVLSGQKAIWSAAAITAQAGAMGSATMAARGLYAALGGPVGLAVGLGGVIASMYLFRDSADSATESLKNHSKYVDMTTESLVRLEGAQRLAANDSLAIEVETQSSKIKALNKDFVEYIATLTRTHKGNQELERIYAELRSGVIDVEEAFNRLNKTDAITSEEITKAAEYEKKHKELSVTLSESRTKLTATSTGIRSVGNDAKQTAAEVAGLSEEIKNLFKQANNNVITSTVTKRLADLNYDDRLISIINKYVAVEGSINTATGKFYDEVKKRITEEYRAVLAQDKALESRNQREKERLTTLEKQTKLTEKQLKNGQRLIGISGNSGIGTGAHLDVRYGGSRDGEKVSKAHLARLQAGGKSLSSYRVTSDYGQRKAPTKGASSFHKGIDFAMPVGTPITTSVAVKDVKTAYDAKGGGYYSTVTFEDGVVLKLLHQAPSVMSKVKGGSSDGTLKSNQDLERQAEQQAKTQLQLQMAVATERKRIETQLQEDIKEIKKAGFSPEETKRLIAEYQARADNDIAIAEYALRTKLDDYKDFQKSEEELLKDSFDQKKFYAARDIELTKEQRNEAVQLLEKQYQQEAGLLELAKQERLFQAEQAYSHEIYRIQESGRIEREQIRLTTKDAAEASRLIEASFKKQKQAANDALKSISEEWRSIQSRFSGMGEVGYINQEFKGYNETADKYRDAQRSAAEEDAARKREQLWRDEEVNRTISAEEAAQRRIEIEQNVATRLQEIDLEHFQNRIELEKQYYLARAELGLTYGEEIAGNWADVFKQMYGEQSSAYAAMFALEKGFAVAKALMAAPEAYSKAYNAVVGIPYVGPYIAPVMGGAAAAAQVAQAAIIKGINFTGYETGGYTGNYGKSEVAGVVHGQEYVLNAEATRRVGINTLNAINSGADIQAERQAQANVKAMPQQSQPQVIDNNLRVIMVKDENEAKDWLYSSDGEKAFLYHMKRNRSKI